MQFALDLKFYVCHSILVIQQKLFRIFFTLTDFRVIIRKPRTALFYNSVFHGKVEDAPRLTYALSVDNIEFGNLERRSKFVFDDFDSRPVAYNIRTVFYLVNPPYVKPYAGVKFERLAARCGFRRT